MASADEFKAKGNAALQAGNISEAIEHYSAAIRLDGANHVYFSNRSAAYLKKGDAHNALEDANSCIGLNPAFAKGYSRKGAALHSLKRYNDSMAAYKEGIAKFPNDAGLKNGLESVEKEKDAPSFGVAGSAGGPGNPLTGLFSPQMVAQMALDPSTRHYLNDPDVMAKIKMVQQNPNLLGTVLNDPKMMDLLSKMMGAGGAGGFGGSEDDSPTPTPSPTTEKKEEKTAAPMEVEEEEEEVEDISDLSPEEKKKKMDEKAALEKKQKGNDYYKNKEFEKALECYDAAIALNPTSMTFLSNKAAVYFTQKKYDECIEECLKAVEVGKENRASFEERAKAYTRAAKAYQKKKDLDKAIEMCQKAQLESHDKNTLRMMKQMELERKKSAALAYQDDEKAEAAKQEGNDFFRAQKWSEAVAKYEEAVKRAPKNAPIRNNLSAALCKIMDFTGAKRQVEVALELDPKYVKAWARKGDIEIVMKEYHKAKDSYEKGLSIDPENPACTAGLRKVIGLISYARQSMTEAEKKEQAAHAMADPEIQAILQDPLTQQLLRDFSENPAEAQKAMGDPTVRAKMEKLVAAGIVEMG